MRFKGKSIFSVVAMLSLLLIPGISKADGLGDDVSISGFVDTAYYKDTLSETSSFSLDQAEVDIEKEIKGVGGLRVDIQHVKGSTGTTDEVLEQGYVWVNLGSDLKLTFGKFNAPIGFELLDPNDMYQYSHAMIFNYGLPTNLTGAMVSGGAGIVDFAVYAVNGWDLINDDNDKLTVGGRVGVTPLEGVNVGVSYITGDEGAAETELSVVDVDATITVIEDLTIGAEYNSGEIGSAEWSGFLVMVNYVFTDKIALTLRYDSFNDKDGARLGSGSEETRNAITVSPSYAIADGFGVLAEYRLTTSDEETFTDADGNAEDSQSEFAVKFTYSF